MRSRSATVVHPRAGGEHAEQGNAEAQSAGPVPVHPCAGGEHLGYETVVERAVGSVHPCAGGEHRDSACYEGEWTAVHPCAGGEHHNTYGRNDVGNGGSSLRGRGTLLGRRAVRSRVRGSSLRERGTPFLQHDDSESLFQGRIVHQTFHFRKAHGSGFRNGALIHRPGVSRPGQKLNELHAVQIVPVLWRCSHRAARMVPPPIRICVEVLPHIRYSSVQACAQCPAAGWGSVIFSLFMPRPPGVRE